MMYAMRMADSIWKIKLFLLDFSGGEAVVSTRVLLGVLISFLVFFPRLAILV